MGVVSNPVVGQVRHIVFAGRPDVRVPENLAAPIMVIRKHVKEIFAPKGRSVAKLKEDYPRSNQSTLELSYWASFLGDVTMDNDIFLDMCRQGEGMCRHDFDNSITFGNKLCKLESTIAKREGCWDDMSINDRGALSRVMDALTMHSKKSILLGASKGTESKAEKILAEWEKIDNPLEIIRNAGALAMVQRACPLSRYVSFIYLWGKLFLTSQNYAIIVPIKKKETDDGKPSYDFGGQLYGGEASILDYSLRIDNDDVALSTYITNRAPSHQLIRYYRQILISIKGNNERVKMAKIVMRMVDYWLDTENNPEMRDANARVLRDLFNDKGQLIIGGYNFGNFHRFKKVLFSDNFEARNSLEMLIYFWHVTKARNMDGKTIVAQLKSLEKYRSIAIGDNDKSIEKYWDRTSKPKVVNPDAIRRIVNLLKKMGAIQWIIKRGTVPSLAPDTNSKGDFNESVARIESVVKRYLRSGRDEEYIRKSLKVGWFDSVKVMDLIDNWNKVEPISYVQDKACLRDGILELGKESGKEIVQLLLRWDLTAGDSIHDDIKLARAGPAEFHWVTNNIDFIEKIKDHIVAKLSNKENEQKEETRAFGIGDWNTKLSLALVNYLCKCLMSCIPDQYMTKTDTEKIKLTHKYADMLNDKEAVSVMIDIAGHNQSFAFNTMVDLFGVVMDGIKGFNEPNWPYLFQNLACFYHYPEGEKTAVILRQHTGIEGWMGYFWGLHTALVMEDFLQKEGITKLGGSCYADDINCIIKLNRKLLSINDLLQKIVDHFAEFGQEVKLSQTAVSVCRLVLLKNIYIMGHMVDTSLKRLMRMSPISESFISNDRMRSDTLQSVEASVYEVSSDHKYAYFLSRVYMVLIMTRHFAVLIQKLKGPIFWNEKSSEDLGLIINKREADRLTDANLPQWAECILTSVPLPAEGTNEESEMGTRLTFDFLNNEGQLGYGSNTEQITKHLMISWSKNKELMDVVTYFIYAPKEIGGFNFLSMLWLSCPGYSNPVVRSLVSLRLLGEVWVQRAMSAIFFRGEATTELDDECSLISSEYPVLRQLKTPNALIKALTIRSLKGDWVKNHDIKEALNEMADAREMMRKLLIFHRKKFCYRVANSFYAQSKYAWIDKLITKVANSRTLTAIKLPIPLLRFQQNFLDLNASRALVFLTPDVGMYVEPVIQRTLFINKEKTYPNVKFSRITEGDPIDNCYMVNDSGDIVTMITAPKWRDEDGEHYITPERSDPVFQKFTRLDENFVSPKDIYTENAYRVAKWILKKSVIDGEYRTVLGKDNITQSLIAVLESWGEEFSLDRLLAADDALGGEIMHRINYLKVKRSATNHLPMRYSGAMHIIFKASFLLKSGSENSNVNFKMMENELCGVMLLFGLLNQEWRLKPGHVFTNVQVSFISFNEGELLLNVDEYSSDILFGGELLSGVVESLVGAYASEEGIFRFNDEELRARVEDQVRKIQILHNIEADEVIRLCWERVTELNIKKTNEKKTYLNRFRSEAYNSALGKLRIMSPHTAYNEEELFSLIAFVVEHIPDTTLACRDNEKKLEEILMKLAGGVISSRSELETLGNEVLDKPWNSVPSSHGMQLIYFCSLTICHRMLTDAELCERFMIDLGLRLRNEEERTISVAQNQSRLLSSITQHASVAAYDHKNVSIVSENVMIDQKVCRRISRVKQVYDQTRSLNGDVNKTDGCRTGVCTEIGALVKVADLSKQLETPICNLTGGRGEILEINDDRKRNQHTHFKDLTIITRSDYYTRNFKSKGTAKRKFNLADKDDVITLAVGLKNHYIECSYLEDAELIGENIVALLVTGVIWIRPGKSFPKLIRGICKKLFANDTDECNLPLRVHHWNSEGEAGVIFEISESTLWKQYPKFNCNKLARIVSKIVVHDLSQSQFNPWYTSIDRSLIITYHFVVHYLSKKIYRLIIGDDLVQDKNEIWLQSRDLRDALHTIHEEDKMKMNWHVWLAYESLKGMSVWDIFDSRKRAGQFRSVITHHIWVAASYLRSMNSRAWIGLWALINMQGNQELYPFRAAINDTHWSFEATVSCASPQQNSLEEILLTYQRNLAPSGDIKKMMLEVHYSGVRLKDYSKKYPQTVNLSKRGIEKPTHPIHSVTLNDMGWKDLRLALFSSLMRGSDLGSGYSGPKPKRPDDEKGKKWIERDKLDEYASDVDAPAGLSDNLVQAAFERAGFMDILDRMDPDCEIEYFDNFDD